MNHNGTLLARILDAGLGAFAAGTVVRQRERLRASGTRVPVGLFEELVADTEVRLLHLAEALATGRPALFLEQIQWTRSSLASRELPEDRLRLNLECLREELTLDLPSHGRGLVGELFERAFELFESPARDVPTLLEDERAHRDLIQRLLLAILEARRGDALDLVMQAVDDGLPISTVELDVIAPVQWEIGHMWQRGEIEVHEEHLGSRIVEEALILLRSKMPVVDRTGKTVLLCSVQGNLHDIGTRIVADHFEMRGWNALCLGANLPHTDIARAAGDFSADLLALSVMLTTHVRDTATTIETVHELCGDQAPPILVGGPPFALAEDLWIAVGADGSARDARSAVEVGERLVAPR